MRNGKKIIIETVQSQHDQVAEEFWFYKDVLLVPTKMKKKKDLQFDGWLSTACSKR
jgi:hypothetical protein